ncbi:oxidoreductase [Azorhizobium oxalatiphilum]|uniref:Oxidoreductase n=1 Tax=Azorhizobium oxalatiphilum TaxID=980631 RepID=A0A917CA61_9HYPH|nr:FAD-binding oxidoreductase [Azorhizobium oxalatiphilum]GGF81401.1 oxidoreductase [Azorhizobium oxalatiphilum]
MTSPDPHPSHPASWYAATAGIPPAFSPLKADIRADVAIVGGGYTGLSAALHLARAGVDVVLLEAGRVGAGASGRNGGQIHTGQRRDQSYLEGAVGREDARKMWELAQEAKSLLRALVIDHSIECDWTDGLIHAAHKPALVEEDHAYARHLRDAYGYQDITPLSREEVRALVASDAYHGGTLDKGGGHLHPLKLAFGLAGAAAGAGARLFEGTRALSFAEDASGVRIRTSGGHTLTADRLLECGDGLMDGLDRRVDAHVMSIANYIAATEPLGERGAALITNNAAVADSRFVVNYFRLSPDKRLLFGGGESYRPGLRSNIPEFVRPYMLRIFPQLADVRIDFGWGGLLGLTMSRNPFVRRLSERVLVAAGYSGQGVLLAPLFGKILAEAVAGDMARLDVLSRFPVPAFPGGPLMRYPLLVAGLSYYALRDRL